MYTGLRYFAVIALLVMGCGEDYEYVSYDKPKRPADIVIAVPDVTLSDLSDNGLPIKFTTPTTGVVWGSEVVFEGAIINKLEMPLGTLLIKFTRPGPQGKPVTAQAGFAKLKEEGGKFKYRIQLRAPRSIGTYKVELSCTLPTSERKKVVLGESMVKIEK